MIKNNSFYSEIGLRAGLEVHQQLDTGKLFCRCPTLLIDSKPDFIIERRLRPAASELGEFDAASLIEFEKQRIFQYNGNFASTCLVETDEEPVHPANKNAITVGLTACTLMNATIFDELFTMRKTVIDGSNTSGFQRTMLLARNGKISINGKQIGIQTIVLEEDAARPVEKTEDKVIYNLDRLGFPLIEIATDPDLNTPKEVKACALKLGEIIRITCKAKRGLGTIRQDVNVSIAKGARVEIKGVQDMNIISTIVEREAQRQIKLLELKDKLKQKANENDYDNILIQDLTNEFSNTKSSLIHRGLNERKKLFAFKLPNLKGLLGYEICPNKRFATELANQIKTQHAVPGLFHSDELPEYGVTQKETDLVRQKVNAKENDGFIIIVCNEDKIQKVLGTIVSRIKYAFVGIPEETRDALEDGNSAYLRPLAGAARMYPETDAPTIKITQEKLNKIKNNLPKTFKQREEAYKKWGLNEKMTIDISRSNNACLFETLIEKHNKDVKLLGKIFTQDIRQLEKQGIENSFFTEKRMLELVNAIESNSLQSEVMLDTLTAWSKNPDYSLTQIINLLGHKVASSDELLVVVKEAIAKNKPLIDKMGERAVGPLMGDVMKQMKGKASGKAVSQLLKQEISKLI